MFSPTKIHIRNLHYLSTASVLSAVFKRLTISTARFAAMLAHDKTASLLMNTPSPAICKVHNSRYALRPIVNFPSADRSSKLVGSRTQLFLDNKCLDNLAKQGYRRKILSSKSSEKAKLPFVEKSKREC